MVCDRFHARFVGEIAISRDIFILHNRGWSNAGLANCCLSSIWVFIYIFFKWNKLVNFLGNVSAVSDSKSHPLFPAQGDIVPFASMRAYLFVFTPRDVRHNKYVPPNIYKPFSSSEPTLTSVVPVIYKPKKRKNDYCINYIIEYVGHCKFLRHVHVYF